MGAAPPGTTSRITLWSGLLDFGGHQSFPSLHSNAGTVSAMATAQNGMTSLRSHHEQLPNRSVGTAAQDWQNLGDPLTFLYTQQIHPHGSKIT